MRAWLPLKYKKETPWVRLGIGCTNLCTHSCDYVSRWRGLEGVADTDNTIDLTVVIDRPVDRTVEGDFFRHAVVNSSRQ